MGKTIGRFERGANNQARVLVLPQLPPPIPKPNRLAQVILRSTQLGQQVTTPVVDALLP